MPLKNSVGQQLLVSYGWDGMICFWQVPAPGSTPGELSCVKTEQLPDVAVSGLVTNADGTRAVAWGGRRVMLMETPGSKTVTVDLPSSVADCMVVSGESCSSETTFTAAVVEPFLL